MSYELKQEDIYGLASYLNARTRLKGDELEFMECPYCHGGDHHDTWTFSINLRTGPYKCLRSSCDAHGHFVELCRDLHYPLPDLQPRRYRELPQKPVTTSDQAVTLLQKRGISESVTRGYRITTLKDNPSVLVFPFYDPYGKLTCIKYRNTRFRKGDKGNKEWFERDTQPILFGQDFCTTDRPLVITEGQIDSLSLTEAGIPNAVSVPNGALGFTWIPFCKAWVEQFREIIVFGDCENGKITLSDTIRSRFPKIAVRTVRPVDYLGEKDANDILRKYGPAALKTAVDRAEVPKIENVKPLSSVRTVDINSLDTILTGIDSVDRLTHGMAMGQLVLLTGKRGEGKSTFMSQIIVNALDAGESVFAYSGELADFHFKRWIDYQLAGAAHITESVNRYGDTVYSIPQDTVKKITDWYAGRMFIYDNDYVPEGGEMESLPDTVERVIRDYGVRLVCIDNLMTAMDTVTDAKNLYLAQGNFAWRLKCLARKYNVVIILVAHPRKFSKGEEMTNDDISGSSDLSNKADIILSYSRTDKGDASCDSYVQILKNRLFGTLRFGKDKIPLYFSPKTKRIFDNDKPRTYKWEEAPSWVQEAMNSEPEPELPF